MRFPHEIPEQFSPGLLLELDYIQDLQILDDEIACRVEPTHEEIAWLGRTPLIRMVYPSKFHGNMNDITVKIMDWPVQRLYMAQELAREADSPIKFNDGNGKVVNRRRDFLKDVAITRADDVIGATFRANASGQSQPLGLVEVDMWWAPLKPEEERSVAAQGEALLRVVTFPRYDTKKFAAYLETSKRRGIRVRQGKSGKRLTGPPLREPN